MPGFFRRLSAALYDSLLLLAILFFATALLLPLNAGQAFSPDQWGYPLYLLAISFGFYGWFWTHGGQTLGLRAWKLQLVCWDGSALSWQRASVRFVGMLLAWGCFGLGIVWSCWDKNGYCWHDYLSKTHTIRLSQ